MVEMSCYAMSHETNMEKKNINPFTPESDQCQI